LGGSGREPAASTTWDVITDFTRGQDKIDLRTIDAFGVGGTNAAFVSEHSQRKLRKTKDRMDKDKRLVC
jgi:hypothetical protein